MYNNVKRYLIINFIYLHSYTICQYIKCVSKYKSIYISTHTYNTYIRVGNVSMPFTFDWSLIFQSENASFFPLYHFECLREFHGKILKSKEEHFFLGKLFELTFLLFELKEKEVPSYFRDAPNQHFRRVHTHLFI